jgi:hypothetical protein
LVENNTTAIPLPDTSLWKAIAYVADKIGEEAETFGMDNAKFMEASLRGENPDVGQCYSKTRNLMRQKASFGQITIWGKKQIDNPGTWGALSRTFDEILTPIPAEYWSVSKIAAFCAVEQKNVNNPYTLPAQHGAWEKERNAYADLHVNWQQITGCWGNAENLVREPVEKVVSEPAISFLESDSANDRRVKIREFMEKTSPAFRSAFGRNITKKDLWSAVGYREATEFERFQKNAQPPNDSATERFSKLLNLSPEDFVKRIKTRPN